MNHVQVGSSNINSVGYDPDSSIMEIEFRGGKRYRYEGVDADTHAALVGAESVGGHFHNFIRPHYTGVKVEQQS